MIDIPVPIKLACLDLSGTTAGDAGTVERAFAEAIATQGVVPGTSAYARAMVHVHRFRGCPSIDVFRGIFPDNEARAQVTNLAFERSYESALDRLGMTPLPGALEALEKLRSSGVKTCLVTGFRRKTFERILTLLGWHGCIDLHLCSDDVERGRPWPDTILRALTQLEIDDVRKVAVIGDTEADILSGRRAGAAIVAGVLTGAHSKDRLQQAGATHIVDTIADFPALVLDKDLSTHQIPSAAR
ncbi:HAD family hydrolase [Rhizohabitans arisaemae]|uniref:HAD family hydrolase n=1 Tax=Rhizohabitans arisaemae TaxID=2720610 RepID=UPI0024B21FB4|nr:HAD family hydrolase [Rhizohabitans arisaemae]